MRVLFFNRSFWPDVEATGQLLTELCEDLSREHEITVVAGRPYNMERFGSWLPIRREQLGRVAVLRAYNPRLNKRFLVARIVNLFSYFLFSAVAGFFARKPDVVIAETDPPILGLVGWFFARWHRAKFVFYLHDLYPDVAVALGRLRNGALVRFLDSCTRFILRHADRVVVLGEDMRRRLQAKDCVASDKVQVIANWVDTQQVRPQPISNAFRREHGLNNHFVVMFSGNLGLTQGMDSVIEAASQLKSRDDIRFVFVGEGAAKENLIAEMKSRGLTNVQFVAYQPKERLSESLSAADLHLVPMRRGLAGMVVPSKTYGIMAVGRPFLAVVDAESDIAAVVREHQCGLWVQPDSAEELRKGIEWGFAHRDELSVMGRRGRAAAEKHFDRKIAAEKFRKLLIELNEASC